MVLDTVFSRWRIHDRGLKAAENPRIAAVGTFANLQLGGPDLDCHRQAAFGADGIECPVWMLVVDEFDLVSHCGSFPGMFPILPFRASGATRESPR